MGGTRLGYGIFVRFRRSRLPLRRGIAKLEDALALAEQFRAERFHKPDAVIVVKESDDTIVTAAPSSAAPSSAPTSGIRDTTSSVEGSTSAPAGLISAMGDATSPVEAPSPSVAPHAPTLEAAPAPPTPEPSSGWLTLAPPPWRRWAEQLRTMQEAIARARRAQARLESAYASAGSEIQIYEGAPPAALVYRYQRLGSLCDATRRTTATMERSAEMLEQQLRLVGTGVAVGSLAPLASPRTSA